MFSGRRWPRFIGDYSLPEEGEEVNYLICPRIEDRDLEVPIIPGEFRCRDCRKQVSVAQSSWWILEEKRIKTIFICRPCWDGKQKERD